MDEEELSHRVGLRPHKPALYKPCQGIVTQRRNLPPFTITTTTIVMTTNTSALCCVPAKFSSETAPMRPVATGGFSEYVWARSRPESRSDPRRYVSFWNFGAKTAIHRFVCGHSSPREVDY